MPKLLSEQQLNNVKYVSMADYMRHMDEIEDMEDKLAYTTRYLLAYGDGQQRDVSLAEAIHIAKLKIADASAKLRENIIMVPDEAVDPHIKPEEDAANRRFMVEPVEYLHEQANRLIYQAANGEVDRDTEKRIEDLQVMTAVLMDRDLPTKVSELEIEPTARDVDARLKARCGGPKQFEELYKSTKPGVFSKLFGTSSTAYHNLEAAYDAFNNPDHADYGNMNSLDKAATEYLQHCFPRWNPRAGEISKSAINILSGTQKARAMFSYQILKATAEQRKTEQVFENIVNANNQLRSDAEAQAGDEVLENLNAQNEQFQNELFDDVSENDVDALSQDERDYHANFENVPDVENPDDPAVE